MIIKNVWREPTGRKVFVPTEKDPGWSGEENAYWALAGAIGDKLGPEGGTLGEIYHEVLGPLGLSLDDTRTLVRGAVKEGYLK